MEDAKLYIRPGHQSKIIGAAITRKTAEWVGGWADGRVMTSRPPEKLKPVVEAFWRGGGEGKPMILQVQFSQDRAAAAARRGVHEQWRNTCSRAFC